VPDPALDARNAPAPLLEMQARLDAQRKLVDELRMRYTERHPDLANGRRALAELEAEMKRRKDEVAAQMRTPRGRRSVQSGNPLYQKLRSSFAEAEAQVAGLQAQLRTKQAALEEARAAVGRIPQVEAELAQLNRDYDVVRRRYEALVARREAAALGAKLDQGSRLAEFRVVEPSRVSDQPVFPSRSQLAWISVLASLATALLAGTALRMLRPTVDSALALAKTCGRPVIGAVSIQVDAAQERAERRRLQATLAAMAALVLLQAGWAAWMTWRAATPLGAT
jgi:polysaccharide chain length determinant protein (PEP-CTERM system associated)